MKKTLKIDNKRVQSKISGISLTLVLLLQIFFMSYVVIDKGFTQEVQGFSNPVGTPVWTYTTGNDIVSTPAIADLDNDGKVEVVFGSKDSKIYCLYGENSTLKWSYTTGEIYSSPSVVDSDNDGIMEVFIGSWSGYFYCFYGNNGTLKWSFSTGKVISSDAAIGDVDNDGKIEVVFGTRSLGFTVYCFYASNGTLKWSYDAASSITSPLLADLNEDGKIEVIIGLNMPTNNIYVLHGENGTVFWSYSTGGANIEYAPSLGDVDFDGKIDILFGTSKSTVFCFNGNGTLKWSMVHGTEYYRIDGTPMIGDVDKDGYLEVIYSYSQNKYVYCLYAHNGTEKWSKNFGDIYVSCAIADFDNDGYVEILYGCYSSIICIYGLNGTQKWSYSAGDTISSLILGDVDSDGKLELLFGSVDNKLYCLAGSGPVYAQPGPWPCYGGSSLQQRNYFDADGDNLTDSLENVIGSNPSSSDTDGDLISDWNEVTRYLSNPDNSDTDGDGLSDHTEINTYLTNPTKADTDGDGMPDGWEVSYGFNPRSQDGSGDPDGDSLSNVQEYIHGTTPTISDTDSDGMPDGWEVTNGLNPLINDAGSDSDSDGLTNIQEYTEGTDPFDSDSDDDALTDGAEVNTHLTDPTNADSDSDGMPDGWEVTYGLNPLANNAGSDSDSDGLTHLQEYTHGTHPFNSDTDSDGMPDGWEVTNALNPLLNDAGSDSDSDGLTNLQEYTQNTDPFNEDSDSDGMPDGWEVTYGLNPLVNNAGNDPDADGLTHLQEYTHGTHPFNPDSDGDGLTDGVEVNTHLTDPTESDTDSDGMPDGWEVTYTFNPLADDSSGDLDSDGLSNLVEYNHNTFPNNPDSDGDGLIDGQEINTYHTNPRNSDTDGDGLNDEAEINTHLTDPTKDDTDSDGLTDWQEIFIYLTDPRNPDTDKDGFKDGIDFNPMNFLIPTGIIIIIIGALIGFVVIRKSAQVLKVKKENRKQELNRLEKEKKEAQEKEELERQRIIESFRDNPPSSLNDITKALNTLQQYIVAYVQANDLENAIKCTRVSIMLYDLSIKKGEEMGLDTIIEVSKETKEKTRDNLYKLLQKQFNDRLSELSLLLNEHRNKTEFHQANKKIKEIHELCDSYIKNLQEFKKIDEIQEISDNIVKPLKKMEEENMIAEKYRLKIVDYNYIVEALQAKELESAVKAQKALKDDLGKFATEVLQSNLTNEIKNHFLNLIEDLTNKTKDLEQKIAGSMKSLVQGTAVNLNLKSEKMGSLQFTQLAPVEQVEYKIPLYAKVVLLGESSVGKTHLILSMTGLDYSVTQGSTIGMDKYYKLVKMPYKRYETQLCFWDLGGQWNFRAINSLFLNEASVIVLVFDVTRAETFQKLDYWYEQLKHCRLSDNVPLIVVANKIDVGGLAISPEIIQGALAKYGIDKSKFFVTSAKTKEQIRELLECIAGAVDWGKLIEKFDNELGIQVALELKNLAADTKIISRSDLINILKKSRPKSEELEINAILEHYASQDKIQFGLSSSFVVLDPEFIDKKIGKILEIASKNEGRIDITEIERVLGLNRENIHRFIEYLCAENICFKLSDTLYIFPNVIHKQELPIDEYLQAILNSGTIEKAIEFEGPADFLFIQVLVALNREFGAAKAISNTTGIWEYGQGKDKTAFITNYYSGDKKGVIRFKAGGGNGEMMIQGALYVLKSVFTAHRVIFQEMQ